MLTLDGAYFDDVTFFEKFMLDNDRGKNVRTINGYLDLVSPIFSKVEYHLGYTLYIPQRTFLMKCIKN